MIAFAFQWYFYLVLFFIVGFMTVVIMFIFLVYHRIMAWGEKKAKFKFRSYLKLIIPPAIYGIGLAIIPVAIINLLIAVLVKASVYGISFAIQDCDTESNQCILTIFDKVRDTPGSRSKDINYDVIWTGRVGLAFCVVGTIIMYTALRVMIPNKQDDSKVYEAYDGNTWLYFNWKRTNFVLVTLIYLFFNIIMIYFSFSAFFGNNNYLCIFLIKVV